MKLNSCLWCSLFCTCPQILRFPSLLPLLFNYSFPPQNLTSPLAVSTSSPNPSTSTSTTQRRGGGEMTTLGKRHRNNSSLRRTTSMSGFAVVPAEEETAGRRQPAARAARSGSAAPAPTEWGALQRRHSGDGLHAATETAAFLKACGLCSRRLGPGRDTFIYMGEVAFCSLECRQEQMNLDELKEKKCFPPAVAAAFPTEIAAP